MLHEYAHYGDAVTNNGIKTGQEPLNRERGDKPFSTKEGQLDRAVTKHRGTDVDQRILLKNVYTPRSSSYVNIAYWKLDGKTLEPEFKMLVDKSIRFGPPK